MSSKDNIKVYLFYLNEDKSLYAFTINKEYKNKFSYQRNKKCFTMKKIYMDKYEFKSFSYKYKDYMLQEIPLNIGLDKYEMIVATNKEESGLMSEADALDNAMDCLHRDLVLQSNFKTKYLTSLEYLTTTAYVSKGKNGDTQLNSKINLLYLFMKLYKNTFTTTDDNL